MIIKNEINITEESEYKLRELFSRYKETEEQPEVINDWCVIHLYPKEDTINENGETNGYCDALFFDIHVFNCDNKTVYKARGWYDAIHVEKKCELRLFKDMSTMLIFRDGVEISWGQAIFLQ